MSSLPDYDIHLVLPCFRESARLPKFLESLCQAIEESKHSIGIQIVDDGSGSIEQARLSELVSGFRVKWPFLRPALLLPQNLGKGGAIKAGWNSAPASVRWLAFVDADGAADATTVLNFLAKATTSSSGLAIATRRGGDGSNIVRRSAGRAFAAALFNRLIRCRYDIDCLDTQCGLKAIAASAYETISSELVQNRFEFDLELLIAAQRHGIALNQIPIDWTETPGSQVTVASGLKFAWNVLTRRI